MKYCAALFLCASLISGPALAETGTGDAADTPAAASNPKPAKKAAKTTTGTSSAKKEVTGSAGTAPKVKKTAHRKEDGEPSPRARSGAAVVREGGKTCSGIDEYRVCW